MSRINRIIPADQYDLFVKYLAEKLQVSAELVNKTISEYVFLDVQLPLDDSHLLLFCEAWVAKIPLLKRYSAQELLSYFKEEEAVNMLVDYATRGLEAYAEGLVDILVNHPEIPQGLKMEDQCTRLSEVFVETCRSPEMVRPERVSPVEPPRKRVSDPEPEPPVPSVPFAVSAPKELPLDHASALLASLTKERNGRDPKKGKSDEEIFAPLEGRIAKVSENRKVELPPESEARSNEVDGVCRSDETTLPIDPEVRALIGEGGPISKENAAKLRYRQESERKHQSEGKERKEKSIFGSSTSEEEEKPKKPNQKSKKSRPKKESSESSSSSSSSDSSTSSESASEEKPKPKKGKVVPPRKGSAKKVPAKKAKSRKVASSESSDSSDSSELSSISSSSEEIKIKKSRKR